MHDAEPSGMELLARHMPTQAVPAGTVLIQPSAWGRQVYLIHEGTVRIFEREPGGREMTLGLIRPGQLLGAGTDHSQVNGATYAEAATALVVGVADGAEFHELVERVPGLARLLVRELAAEIVEVDQRFAAMGALDGRHRLERLLEQLAHDGGEPVADGWRLPGPLRQIDIAHQIGLSRETVTRLIGKLEAEGQLRREGSTLVLLANRELGILRV
jgi:CRP-like cAMP-binding protein